MFSSDFGDFGDFGGLGWSWVILGGLGEPFSRICRQVQCFRRAFSRICRQVQCFRTPRSDRGEPFFSDLSTGAVFSSDFGDVGDLGGLGWSREAVFSDLSKGAMFSKGQGSSKVPGSSGVS